jgi:AraC family transcriptional regulator of adaptative response / DNA-3-methyladenine glycosylase II
MRAESMFGFMSKRAVPGVDEISGTRWHRLARFGSSDGVITLSVDGSVASLTVPSTAAREIHSLVNRARRSLDLSADPSAIEEHLSRDRKLRPLVRRFRGTRIPLAWDPFETSVRAIVGQQVSVAAATTIMSRIAANFGERAVSDETLAHFPSPQRLAEADLSTVGLTKARAAALTSLAKNVADNPGLLDRGASLDEAVERLCAMRGIGPWTAQYIAMRAIGEPDAFPHSDLGLRKAAEKIGIAGDDLLACAEQWRPWRAYAAMILWESLA